MVQMNLDITKAVFAQSSNCIDESRLVFLSWVKEGVLWRSPS
jgi:hypothetical protein